MLELARVSERAVWEEYGRSYEGRPLGHLIISSPENLKNLEQLRIQHLQLSDPENSSKSDIKNMPVFIKLDTEFTATNQVPRTHRFLLHIFLQPGRDKKQKSCSGMLSS